VRFVALWKRWAWNILHWRSRVLWSQLDFISEMPWNEWQLATAVDYNLPERFDLSTWQKMAHKRPVMIHRAPFGSLERLVF